MTVSPIVSTLRLLTAALVACAFLIAPVADAQHVDIEPATACDVSHETSDSGERAPNDDGHDHHAHNCGPCHIHHLRKDFTLDSFVHLAKQPVRPPLSLELSSLPPGSLYRPPRA